MSFDAAFERTVGVEGRYSKNPADPGGETMFGITIKTAKMFGYTAAMRDLSLDRAKQIYRAGFWDLLHLGLIDAVSQPIAEELFDTAVNCGTAVPVPFLQRWLNAFNRQGKDYQDQPVDGHVGTLTIVCLTAFMAKRGKLGERVMLAGLNSDQALYYRDLADRRPEDESFIFGWIANRVGGD